MSSHVAFETEGFTEALSERPLFERQAESFKIALTQWWEMRAERRRERDAIAALKGMSDYGLQDIGISRGEVVSVFHTKGEGRSRRFG